MEKNIYDCILERSQKAGLTLYETCRRVGIPYETLRSWRKKEPKSLKTVRVVMVFLEEKDPFSFFKCIEKHLENNSLYMLSKHTGVSYELLQRWIRWDGLPKTLQTILKIDEILETEERKKEILKA